MIKTKSSKACKGFEYSEGKLTVQFKQGVKYIYDGVPESEYKILKSCESTGKKLNEIKKKYKCYKELS